MSVVSKTKDGRIISSGGSFHRQTGTSIGSHTLSSAAKSTGPVDFAAEDKVCDPRSGLSLVFTPEYYEASPVNTILRGLVSITAPKIVGTRPPLDLTLVLDRSGSMSGLPLDLVKVAVQYILSQLKDQDRLAVLHFGSDVKQEFGLEHCSAEAKKKMWQRVRGISDEGCTNLSEGVLCGLGVYNKDFLGQPPGHRHGSGGNTIGWLGNHKPSATLRSDDRIRSLFLLTDGQANSGVTDGVELSKKIRDALQYLKRQKKMDVSVHTFGFGSGHDPEFLKKISHAGHGDFLYIEAESAIGRTFGTALGGVMSTCARDVVLEWAFGPDVSLNKHILFPGLQIASLKENFEVETAAGRGRQGLKLRVKGDLFSEERRDIPVVIRGDFLSERFVSQRHGGAATVVSFGELALSYFDYHIGRNVFASNRMELRLPIVFPAQSSPLQQLSQNPRVSAQFLRLEALQAMETAKRILAGEEERTDEQDAPHGLFGTTSLTAQGAGANYAGFFLGGAGSQQSDVALKKARCLVQHQTEQIIKILERDLGCRVKPGVVHEGQLHPATGWLDGWVEDPFVGKIVSAEYRSDRSNAILLLKNLWEDMSDLLRDMQTRQTYEEVGHKKMLWHAGAHSKQRCMGQANNINCNSQQQVGMFGGNANQNGFLGGR